MKEKGYWARDQHSIYAAVVSSDTSERFQRNYPFRWFSDNKHRQLDCSGEQRILTPFSLLVGDSLDRLLRVGDRLRILRDSSGDSRCALVRDCELI